MILQSNVFDQQTLAKLRDYDPVVLFYRTFFSFIDWSGFIESPSVTPKRGRPANPKTAYIKALLVKLVEGKEHVTELREFLVKHPLLVIELGFTAHLDENEPYGFNVETTVPSASWLRTKQQKMDHALLQDLFHRTVMDLSKEIDGLGETIAVDVKHIYAWVKENNPRESIKDRYDKEKQPKGDPDCKLGVKKSTNQEQPDGSKKVHKEYLWGYGTGIVSATIADYGDMVLAEYTQPFNESDVSYYCPVYQDAVNTLQRTPVNITADAAYDAWYVYETCTNEHGIAAIPLNCHGKPAPHRDTDGVPLCDKQMRMVLSYEFDHPNGYRAQRYSCPLLYPQATGQTCENAQFAKGKGCVKDINAERGGLMRVMTDRNHPLYKAIYCQRTSAERINSQAKALGIERPHVRNIHSIRNLNTLTYIIINVKALQRARSINSSILKF